MEGTEGPRLSWAGQASRMSVLAGDMRPSDVFIYLDSGVSFSLLLASLVLRAIFFT